MAVRNLKRPKEESSPASSMCTTMSARLVGLIFIVIVVAVVSQFMIMKNGATSLFVDYSECFINPTTKTKKDDDVVVDWSTKPLIGYMTQGPAKDYDRLAKRFEKAFNGTSSHRFFYHSYDEDCEACIFLNKSTHAEGLNVLSKAALLSLVCDRAVHVRRSRYSSQT